MGWLSGYTYRKKGSVVATAAGAQTNYQMKLTVAESNFDVLLDSMDVTTGWTHGYGSAITGLTVNTVTKKEGSGALNLTKGGTTVDAFIEKEISSTDLRNTIVKFWLHIKDQATADKIEDCEIFLFSPYRSRYSAWLTTPARPTVGWNLMSCDTATTPLMSTTPPPDLSAITGIRLDVDTYNATDTYAGTDVVADYYRYSIGAHCNNRCLNFPNDIRFTKANGKTKHDYWVKSITGTTPTRLATIWIEAESIPASGSADMYMYYKKSGDSGESNRDNTFVFFADFEDCNINDDSTCEGFTENSGNWKVIAGKVLRENTGGDDLTKRTLSSGNYLIQAKLKTGRIDAHWGPGLIVAGMACGTLQWRHKGDDATTQYVMRNLGPWSPTYHPVTWETSFRDMDIAILADRIELYFEDVLKHTYTPVDTSGTKELQLLSSSGADNYFDEVTVRVYAAPEPTWAAWGSEKSKLKRSFCVFMG